MPEPEPVAVILEHPPGDTLRQHAEQLEHRPLHRHRQVGHGEAGPQDRGTPQRLQHVLGQEAEAAQDRQPHRRRQHYLRHLGPPAGGLDHSLLRERAQHLGHEQRIARRAGQPGQQSPARGRAHRVGRQFRHRLLAEPVQAQVPARRPLQRGSQLVQLGGARRRPEARDDPDRKVFDPASQRGQRQQARRVGPLQVVHADQQRPGQRELLHQVGERVDHPEPQSGVAGHGDRVALPGGSGQQLRDGRPPGVRRGPGAAEHPGHEAERPHALQFLGPPRRHLHAAPPRVLQRRVEQARLADAGLALDEHDRAPAGLSQLQRVAKHRDLRLTPADGRHLRQRTRRPGSGPANSRQTAYAGRHPAKTCVGRPMSPAQHRLPDRLR